MTGKYPGFNYEGPLDFSRKRFNGDDMTTMQNITGIVDDGTHAVHLLLQEGAGVLGGGPEKMMAEIETRACTVGRVLEEILHEPHGEPASKLD